MNALTLGPVGNVFFFVPDLDAAVAWYEALLGLTARRAMPQLAVWQLGATRLTLHAEDDYDARGLPRPGRCRISTWPMWTRRPRFAWRAAAWRTGGRRPCSRASGWRRYLTRSATCWACASLGRARAANAVVGGAGAYTAGFTCSPSGGAFPVV